MQLIAPFYVSERSLPYTSDQHLLFSTFSVWSVCEQSSVSEVFDLIKPFFEQGQPEQGCSGSPNQLYYYSTYLGAPCQLQLYLYLDLYLCLYLYVYLYLIC